MLFSRVVVKYLWYKDTPTTEIYTYLQTLSLHVALPICFRQWRAAAASRREAVHGVGRLDAAQFRPPRRIYDPDLESDRPRPGPRPGARRQPDRKSTRLNSSH